MDAARGVTTPQRLKLRSSSQERCFVWQHVSSTNAIGRFKTYRQSTRIDSVCYAAREVSENRLPRSGTPDRNTSASVSTSRTAPKKPGSHEESLRISHGLGSDEAHAPKQEGRNPHRWRKKSTNPWRKHRPSRISGAERKVLPAGYRG